MVTRLGCDKKIISIVDMTQCGYCMNGKVGESKMTQTMPNHVILSFISLMRKVRQLHLEYFSINTIRFLHSNYNKNQNQSKICFKITSSNHEATSISVVYFSFLYISLFVSLICIVIVLCHRQHKNLYQVVPFIDAFCNITYWAIKQRIKEKVIILPKLIISMVLCAILE